MNAFHLRSTLHLLSRKKVYQKMKNGEEKIEHTSIYFTVYCLNILNISFESLWSQKIEKFSSSFLVIVYFVCEKYMGCQGLLTII